MSRSSRPGGTRRTRRGVAAAVPLAVVATLVFAAPSEAARPKCYGKRATEVGTTGADRLVGGPGPDVIVGLAGNDVILGRTGADRICAGSGSDFVRAGGGADSVDGGISNDTVAGDVGEDLVEGGSGTDTVYGGDGRDELRAGRGNASTMFGNTGNDRLVGDDGFDVLVGQEGNDRLNGGPGRFDVASFLFADNPEGVSASIAAGAATGEGDDVLINIESLEGSRRGDELTGHQDFNAFYPHEGDDSIVGGGGPDLLSFLFSNERVTADLMTGTAEGEGSDTFAGIRSLQGSRRADNLIGNLADNELYGEPGGDTLSGNAGDDLLDGGKGEDTGDGGLPPDGVPGGDRCVSIEHRTDCESTSSSASAASPLGQVLGELQASLPALPPPPG